MGNVLTFKKKEKTPPDLEWARPLIENQKTQKFKDISGYYKALGEGRALRKFEKRKEEECARVAQLIERRLPKDRFYLFWGLK